MTEDSMTSACTLILDDTYAKWHSAQRAGGPIVHGRGHAFIHDSFVEGKALVETVLERCVQQPAKSAAVLKDLIPLLNGSWALIVQWPDGRTLAATDRLRSIPLFYAEGPGGVVLSSSVYSLSDAVGRAAISEHGAIEYLFAGYVTGDRTLYEGIKQIQAGQILECGPQGPDPEIGIHKYHRFLPTEYSSASEQELEREFETVLDRVFSRHVRAFADRQMVVPLSGGLDSRLLLGMLKRHGAKDVLCYTYGVAGNEESSISRQVAAALGYHWEFVEYNKDVWARWMTNEAMPEYWRYCAQGVSLPVLSHLPAIQDLLDSRTIDQAIFLPGHTGDFISGGHIPHELLHHQGGNLAPVISSVLDHHFDFWPDATDYLP